MMDSIENLDKSRSTTDPISFSQIAWFMQRRYEHLVDAEILSVRKSATIGLDPTAAIKSLRGRGYYKVPSLKGVWYRGPFLHNGAIATLDDWFDAKRLRADYVRTGYRAYGVTRRPVPGHPLGLSLKAEDKRALLAFLRTL